MSKKEQQMSGIKKHNQELKEKKENSVIDAINILKKQGKFSLAELCRKANVSRTYLYQHPELLKLAERYLTTPSANKKTEETLDGYISILKGKNRKLEKENKDLQKQIISNDKYKEKYEAVQAENEKLKAQLKEVYNMLLPDC